MTSSERSERSLMAIVQPQKTGFPFSFLGYHANVQKGLEGADRRLKHPGSCYHFRTEFEQRQNDMGKAITLLTRLPKFIGANAIGTLVDTAVLWLFSHFVFDSYIGEYIISPFISFECAVFSNFLFSFFFVWRDRRYRNQQKAFIHKYIIYNISSSVVFLLKMCILLTLEAIFGWNVVICNLSALCISGLINFSLGEWVIFKQKRV